MSANPIRSIVIVGGGTAGWMAAASLQHHFQHLVKITLIESSHIGTIGVGEATIPTLRRFYYTLGMTDLEVMRATNATCKLGIQFNDWYQQGSSFIHPFGTFGQDLQGIEFHHFWQKLFQKNQASELGDYSLGASLAKHHKFNVPVQHPTSNLSRFDWALHFDAGLFANYMRKFSLSLGTHVIDAKIENVNLRSSDGFIESVTLDSGLTIGGDLFLDCSGFRGLLIEEALKTGYEKCDQWLLCDAAFAVQSETILSSTISSSTITSSTITSPTITNPPSYTAVTARSAGWQWRIPLQNREGNGHVFSTRFMDDATAAELLVKNIKGKLLQEPRKISFTPGRRKQAWNKNCIAIGLAAGFLEPLESTSIALVETAIGKIKMLFPDKNFNPAVIAEFNEMTALEYERVRDFIILHYKLSARTDSEFWRYCRDMPVPDTLTKKMKMFKACGHFVRYRWEMFHSSSWLAIYSGFNYLPDRYDPVVDLFPDQYLQESLQKMKKSIADLVDDSLSHGDFIHQFCTFKEKS